MLAQQSEVTFYIGYPTLYVDSPLYNRPRINDGGVIKITKTKINAYEESNAGHKQILTVSNNQVLIKKLEQLAGKENAQLRLGRAETPDFVVFSAHVRIIDRNYVGQKNWDFFCSWVEELNLNSLFLIIAEKNLFENNKRYRELPPEVTGVKYIEQQNYDLILETAKDMLEKNDKDIPVVKGVRADEIPDNDEKIDL